MYLSQQAVSQMSKPIEYATRIGRTVNTYKNASKQMKNPNVISLSTLEGTARKLSMYPVDTVCHKVCVQMNRRVWMDEGVTRPSQENRTNITSQ